jgi:hypothetical protein
MTKRPAQVLDPGPIWIKVLDPTGSGSTTMVQLIFYFLFFRYVRMHNYPFHNFFFLPTLSTSWKPVISSPEDGGSQHS